MQAGRWRMCRKLPETYFPLQEQISFQCAKLFDRMSCSRKGPTEPNQYLSSLCGAMFFKGMYISGVN